MTNDRVNILLVDDQPARLLTYQSILGELGQNLVLAHSGREALDKLMHDEFAVVLLDVSMPDMDGFETAEMIHAHPRFEKTPIIFVTGIHVSELDRLRGYKAGAVDYVSIPVVPEILRSKVAVLVELYCKRHELRQLNRILANANKQLAEANLTLQAEKTRELETLNATLQRANAELERTNRSLQREVVERARAEQALQEADRNKDEFLAMLAHELRNPLAPIHNALQLMRMQPSAGQSQWAQEVIQRQLAYLTRLVDDLLDVSRITRGKIALTREPLDVATLITRALETIDPLLRERGHELTLQLPPEPLRVDGDPTRLTQALGNVLGNAAKYTERGGHIELICMRQGTDVEIRVREAAAANFRSVHPTRSPIGSIRQRPRHRTRTRAPARGNARG
jgi:signal transduction histidine kinase